MLAKGDKLIVTKDVTSFLKKGDIAEVIGVDGGIISFAFGEHMMHKGVMSTDEYNEYFEKYVEPKAAPTVTEEMIKRIVAKSNIEIQTIYDKCTIVTCELPNGFVIVESSACVSPDNYDEEMGFEICVDKIIDKIWELEGYKLQSELYEEECDCNGCYDCCEYCDECDECDEIDECLDTDLDCDDCEHRAECWGE